MSKSPFPAKPLAKKESLLKRHIHIRKRQARRRKLQRRRFYKCASQLLSQEV